MDFSHHIFMTDLCTGDWIPPLPQYSETLDEQSPLQPALNETVALSQHSAQRTRACGCFRAQVTPTQVIHRQVMPTLHAALPIPSAVRSLPREPFVLSPLVDLWYTPWC